MSEDKELMELLEKQYRKKEFLREVLSIALSVTIGAIVAMLVFKIIL